MGPGMRACGNCGAGTPLGSPDGMCQGCRDERDAIREEAWRRLAAASSAAPVAPTAQLAEDEPQEYVDDLPPAPAPAPRPVAARANPMTFPGQGPSPLRPVSSGANNKVRRRGTGPLRVGEHRFAPERVGYQGVAGQGQRRKAAPAPKSPAVVLRAQEPKASLPWGAMLGGLILAVGLGAWGMKGGQARAAAPSVAFTPAHAVAAPAAQAPAVDHAAVRAMAQSAPLPDRDEASRLGAALLGSAPRFAAPVRPAAPAYSYRAPVAAAAPAAAVRAYHAPRAWAAAPVASYRHAAPAPRAARSYRYAAAPRPVAYRHAPRSLAEAMVITSRPGAAVPGAPRRQGGVEVIGW